MRVSDPEAFVHLIRSAWGLLESADKAALDRLAVVARDYHDSRARERSKPARSDARQTMEVLATSCRNLVHTVQCLEVDTRAQLSSALKQSPELWRASESPSDIGRHLNALASSVYLNQEIERSGRPNQEHTFQECAGRVGTQLLHLPMDCEWLFYELQQYTRLTDEDWTLDQTLRLLAERLSIFAEVAAALMKSDRGPRSDRVMMRTVEALRVEFERTGKLASHSSKNGRLYAGVPTSQFGLFVQSFFSGVEPSKLKRRGISDALEHACWPSRHSGQRRSNLIAREKRNQRITELLQQRDVPIFPPPN